MEQNVEPLPSGGAWISSFYAHRLLETASKLGASRVAICETAGTPLPAKADPDLRITVAQYVRLWAVAVELTGDPLLPVKTADGGAVKASDVLRFSCVTSVDVREALERSIRFMGIYSDRAVWKMSSDGSRATLELVRPGVDLDFRLVDEFALAGMVECGRALAGDRFIPLEVRLAHPPAPHAAQLGEHFGAPIFFDAPHSALVFQADVLSLPMTARDPSLVEYFERVVREAASCLPPAAHGGLTGRVQEELSSRFTTGEDASLEKVAARLGIGARSLRRQLAAEGIVYRALVAEVRLVMARRYLEAGRHSIGEIAFLLGFSEASAFHRAFRRWTGVTPQQHVQARGDPQS